VLINATSIEKGVPEPGTLVLLSLPLMVLVGRFRRASRFLVRNHRSENKQDSKP
jgi:hypothetical protein